MPPTHLYPGVHKEHEDAPCSEKNPVAGHGRQLSNPTSATAPIHKLVVGGGICGVYVPATQGSHVLLKAFDRDPLLHAIIVAPSGHATLATHSRQLVCVSSATFPAEQLEHVGWPIGCPVNDGDVLPGGHFVHCDELALGAWYPEKHAVLSSVPVHASPAEHGAQTECSKSAM